MESECVYVCVERKKERGRGREGEINHYDNTKPVQLHNWERYTLTVLGTVLFTTVKVLMHPEMSLALVAQWYWSGFVSPRLHRSLR